MNFNDIQKGFNFSSDTLRAGFDESLAQEDPAIERFVSEDFIRSAAAMLDMSEEIIAVFLAGRALFQDRLAAALLKHCRQRFVAGEPGGNLHAWEQLPASFHEAAPLFHAYLVLSLVPEAFARNRARGIPDAITRATRADLEMWVRTFRQWNGRWGFNQLPWLANHLRGELFCLGRLQFQIGRFFLPQIILRWAREVVVLAPDGLRYRADGLIDGANGGCDPQSRTTRYRENAAFHEGNLISSEGRVTGETGVFAKADWRRAVVPDDDTLYFHIPATGPMEHASCGESFARARDFFPRYFPAFQPRAFCSTSWLFDSSLANILPATSNIVRFQREFYLLPLEQANDNQMFERVFAKRYEDIAAAPQITSLQKAIVAYYTHGNRLCSARACLLFEDNGWNTPYRK